MCSEAYFSYMISLEYFSLQPSRTVIAVDDYTFNVFHESDNCLMTVLAEIGQLVHKNKWTVCKCGFCHKLFIGTEGEVCCHSAECIEAQKQQKEKNIEENTQEYSAIKRDYDSFVRRYKGYLDVVKTKQYHPDDYDAFMQAKKERMDKMDALKKKLIRNDLPSAELYNLGKQFKAEIKALTEEILEKYGFDVTEVAKIKKPKKELEFSEKRNLSKHQIAQLSSMSWIKEGKGILVTGATGTGKTFILCAFAHDACVMGYTARYYRMTRLIEYMAVADQFV